MNSALLYTRKCPLSSTPRNPKYTHNYLLTEQTQPDASEGVKPSRDEAVVLAVGLHGTHTANPARFQDIRRKVVSTEEGLHNSDALHGIQRAIRI